MRIWVFLIASIVALFTALAEPIACSAQSKLHVLLAADTISPDIAKDMEANVAFMAAAINGNVPPNRLNLISLIDGKFSRESIFDKIDGLTIHPTDAVLFFYSGHGFYAHGRGTFFQPPTDDDARLYLADIIRRVKAKEPRLTVSIVDCCSVIPEGRLEAVSKPCSVKLAP